MFRAALVKVKQIAGEVLRRRVLLAGKQNPKAVQARPQAPQVPRPVPASPAGSSPSTSSVPPGLLRSFVGYRAGGLSPAVGWRRNAARRLVEFRYRPPAVRAGQGQGRGGGPRWGSHLPVYALLGLTLAGGERGEPLGGGKEAAGQTAMRMLPLETCCNIIRDVFKRPDPHLELQTPASFPSDLASYEIGAKLLGKGTSAAIYAARLVGAPSPPEEMLAEGNDEVAVADGDDEEDAAVQMEVGDSETESGNEEEGEQGSLTLTESWDSLSDLEDGSEPESCADEDYDLALKMMFNYNAPTIPKIYEAFERECLPLWSHLDNGAFGLVHWENGHRAKEKPPPLLPSHPNIVEVHHAFVAPIATHDIDEARSLFPAALPPSLHDNGMGEEDTMYLVLKRYDMTLAEYNQTAGPCQSERVAMVILAQLLEGVSHLVHHGIAHRDLKANNILVDLTSEGSPRVVIADFGFCLAGPNGLREIGGNSALMAPEVKLSVLLPTATIDYRKSDAWAVGAMAYEVLGLPNPFYPHGDGQEGLDSGQYEEDDLPALPLDLQPGLTKTISLLLRKDPHKRLNPSVAANILHLLLWQPSFFTFASWEWSGQTSRSAILARQQQLATWLLQVSAGLLCQRSFGGQRSWLGDTERQLCSTFMARVTPSDLLTAANHLSC